MRDEWFPRLVSAIHADGRKMRDLSLTAGLGQNYVQQMIKDGKMPTAPRLFALLDTLGPARTFYVLTGIEMQPEDEPFIREVLSLSPVARQRMMDLISSIRASAA